MHNNSHFAHYSRYLCIGAFLSSIITPGALSLQAAEITWKATNDNNWSDVKNWSSVQVPRSDDLVIFDSTASTWTGVSATIEAGALIAKGKRSEDVLLQPFRNSGTKPELQLKGHTTKVGGQTVTFLISNTSTQSLRITSREKAAPFPVVLGSSGIIQAEGDVTLGTPIQGDHSITKRGQGRLTLGDSNSVKPGQPEFTHSTFSGGFILEEGSVAADWSSGTSHEDSPIPNASPFGTGTLTLRGGTLQSSNGNPRVIPNAVLIDGNVTFGDTPIQIGPILISDQTENVTTLKRDSRLNVTNTTTWEQSFTGDFKLIKDGKGMLVIKGHARVKELIVEQGTLRVIGSLTCEKLEIKETGFLCGEGKIDCPNIINPHQGRYSEFSFTHNGKEIASLVYHPDNYAGGGYLILLHGATRDSGGYVRSGTALANKLGMMLVVPEFDRVRFPTDAYQEGGVMKNGTALQPEEWTFTYIEPLVKEFSRIQGRNRPYYLVGHSAGGQFVCRMSAFLPGEPERIVSVNPGSLIFPTRDMQYPYGFGGLPEQLSNDEAIKRYLAAPMTLYIGTGDIHSDYLPTAGSAMDQGANRVERSRNCFAMAKKIAKEHGWPFAWKIVEADGVDHSSLGMWQHPNAKKAMVGE